MATDPSQARKRGRPTVAPTVEWLAAWSWRLLVIGAALVVVLWLIGRMWVVFLSLLVVAFLARILGWPVQRLRGLGWRAGLAAATVLVGFLVVMASAVTLIGVAVAGELDQIGPTISVAVDDIEDWLVEDSPFEIDRADIAEFRREAGKTAGDALRASSGTLVSGAVVLVEVFVSVLLGLIVTFFALKDGDRFGAWALGLVPEDRRALASRLAGRAWETLGGYLRGAALLGLIEGAIVGTALTLVGAELAVPVATITFLAAFVPFAGAIVSGVVATGVALATGGADAALIVLVVMVVVQQLDNDLLAPMVYGRALHLHPVVVLLAIAGGGALFGIVGSFLAVPVTAVVVNVAGEARAAPSRAAQAVIEASDG